MAKAVSLEQPYSDGTKKISAGRRKRRHTQDGLAGRQSVAWKSRTTRHAKIGVFFLTQPTPWWIAFNQ